MEIVEWSFFNNDVGCGFIPFVWKCVGTWSRSTRHVVCMRIQKKARRIILSPR